jgi:hypothetical protein
MEFINEYGSAILRIITVIFWVVLYRKSRLTGINRFALNCFLIFLTIFVLWNILMLVFERSPRVYLVSWCAISVFELYFIVAVLFKLISKNKEYSEFFLITVFILSIPIIAATVLSFSKRSYGPVNTADSYNQLLLLLGSIMVVRTLLSKELFLENLESFFIFSGLILYFGMHILASNLFFINFLDNWNFGQYATFISLIYWSGSTVVVWKIKSSHLS